MKQTKNYNRKKQLKTERKAFKENKRQKNKKLASIYDKLMR